MSTTQKAAYGTRTALTITLGSLANNTNRESNAVDNTASQAVDALISVTIKTGTSPTAGALVYVWVAASDGTDWTGGASGSDSSYSAAGEAQLQPLMVFTVNGTSNQIYKQVSPLAYLFGGTLPAKFTLIIENFSGASLNASGSGIEVTPVNYAYV